MADPTASRRRPIRVLVAAGHPAARVGAARALMGAGFDVVGECGTLVDAVAAARQRRPDVCLVDTRAGDGGAAAVSSFAALEPAPRVVVLGTGSTADDAFEAFDAGASAYLL